MNKKELEEDIKKLVVARLEVMPSNQSISIGSEGSFTKEEMINHVEEGDNIGKKISQIQLEYLQRLKEGLDSTS